jgi:hypothetical protein
VLEEFVEQKKSQVIPNTPVQEIKDLDKIF